MKSLFITTVVLAVSSLGASAQVQPNDQTTQLVANVSEAFLDQIVREDFGSERAFMSERLASVTTLEKWRNSRLRTIEVAGKTQRYKAHGLTYYQDGILLAAVDFSGPAELPDVFVCGFMLWELASETEIGLVRFEQNVVLADVFRTMPMQDAAQTMTNWRCPAKMIESILGISIQ